MLLGLLWPMDGAAAVLVGKTQGVEPVSQVLLQHWGQFYFRSLRFERRRTGPFWHLWVENQASTPPGSSQISSMRDAARSPVCTDDDLRELVAKWPLLSPSVRAEIMELPRGDQFP